MTKKRSTQKSSSAGANDKPETLTTVPPTEAVPQGETQMPTIEQIYKWANDESLSAEKKHEIRQALLNSKLFDMEALEEDLKKTVSEGLKTMGVAEAPTDEAEPSGIILEKQPEKFNPDEDSGEVACTAMRNFMKIVGASNKPATDAELAAHALNKQMLRHRRRERQIEGLKFWKSDKPKKSEKKAAVA